jgi:lipid-A-disaccharide synthase
MTHSSLPTVFIIAGEASGDALGAKLIMGLNRLMGGEVRCIGVGGDQMAAQGVASLFPMSEISLIGFTEVIPHLPRIFKRIRQTVAAIREARPDCVVTIDSPGFNKRVAKKLKGSGIPVVHYVAPSVWAYRPERAQEMAGLFQHVMALLPFEPDYFRDSGVPCTFVGHPVTETAVKPSDRKEFRLKHGLAEETPLLAILPGSRRGEIERHMPIFREAISQVKARHPNLALMLIVPPEHAGLALHLTNGWQESVIFITNREEKTHAFASSDLALAKSGTVTLELAAYGVPSVVAYKVGEISAWMMRRMIRVRHVNLVNILQRREVVPECIQDFCQPAMIADSLSLLLEKPEERTWQTAKAKEALAMMKPTGKRTASERAAELVLNVMGYVEEEEAAAPSTSVAEAARPVVAVG